MLSLRRRKTYIPIGGLLVCGAIVYFSGVPAQVDWLAIDYQLGPTSAAVFDSEKLLTFSLQVAPDDWRFLREHAKAEQYVPAHLRVGTESVGSVALRFKGGAGSLHMLDLDPDNLPKLSFKIRFDKYEKSARFHGLRRVNLHSMRTDTSLLRERISYQLFRSFGVAAPRCTHAQIVLNGELMGLYALIEQIDGDFAARHFEDDGKGQLYKDAWPRSVDDQYYSEHLKSSTKRADFDRFKAFARALRTKDDSKLTIQASHWTDLDYLLRYAVVDQAIKNTDGIMGWTGSETAGFWNHNYYWYQPESTDRFWMIPWDLDLTLHAENERDAAPLWFELDVDPQRVYLPDNEYPVRAPSCDPLIRALALHARGKYSNVVRELLDGPFSQASTDRMIDTWSAQIRDAVARDPYVEGGWGPRRVWKWKRRVGELRASIASLRQQMLDSQSRAAVPATNESRK